MCEELCRLLHLVALFWGFQECWMYTRSLWAYYRFSHSFSVDESRENAWRKGKHKIFTHNLSLLKILHLSQQSTRKGERNEVESWFWLNFLFLFKLKQIRTFTVKCAELPSAFYDNLSANIRLVFFLLKQKIFTFSRENKVTLSFISATLFS